MRVAVRRHLPALESVLRDVREASVDRIVVGGAWGRRGEA